MISLSRTVHITVFVFIAACLLAATAATPAAKTDDAPAQQQSQRLHQRHHHGAHNQKHTYATKRRPKKEESPPPPHPDSEVETLPGAVVTGPAPKRNATTRLRRVSIRDYYNNNNNNNGGMPQRPFSDWGYHSYNVHNSGHGPAPGSRSGKGDDNRHDVEFIGSRGSVGHSGGGGPVLPDWARPTPTPRRGATQPPVMRRAVTAAPPPLVPARRGYATLPTDAPNHVMPLFPTTEDPFETNTISRGAPPTSPLDAKDMERRHICMQQRTITMPVKTTEVYTRPVWKHINTPCQPPTHPNQMCTRVQLVHEQAYRDVIRHKASQQMAYDCCHGWARETPSADACTKPVCSSRCQNGGTCSGADTCSCPRGFTGRYCEEDINECAEDKPCDQTCVNTHGSYMCRCRDGFTLQADQQSCKKFDVHRDDAFEARDLENDIDNADGMGARLHRLERSLANERVHTNELQKSLQNTYSVVDTLQSRLNTLEKQQQDINRLQTNLYATESRTNRLESMLNLLMKCRNAPNADCP